MLWSSPQSSDENIISGRTKSNPARAIVWSAIAAHLASWVPPNAHVLEIGAGTGYGAGKGALIGTGAAAGVIYDLYKR